MLTRFNGAPFALNPDLIERAEATPDTVITLVDGKHYLVEEPLEVVLERVQHARAAVLAEVSAIQSGAAVVETVEAPHPPSPVHGPAEVIPMRRNT